MVEATHTDPLAQGTVDMHEVIRGKIHDLVCTVNTLCNSRGKSMILTKLDEARHWNEDDKRAKALTDYEAR